MVTRSDWTPVVLLVVLLLLGACVFGTVLNRSEILNPVGAEVTKKFAEADLKATLGARTATQVRIDQDARLTAQPPQQTLAAGNMQATAQADTFKRQRDQEQFKNQMDAANQLTRLGATLLVTGAMIYLLVQFGRWLAADAARREREAQAHLLVEQRRFEELKIAVAQRAYRPANGSGPAKVETVNKKPNGQNVKIPGYVK